MTPEQARKLLGGYATGSLTGAEQEALFSAALEDQELFDALAREQSLRDLLRDPAAKAELLTALDERPAAWWKWRPAIAAVAMAGLAGFAVLMVRQKPQPKTVTVAVLRVQPQAPAVPAAPPSTMPPPPTAPAARPKRREETLIPLATIQRQFKAPAPPAPAADASLAEAPKAEVQLAPVTGNPGGVVGGVIGGVPPTLAPQAAVPPVAAPMFQTQADANAPQIAPLQRPLRAAMPRQPSARARFFGALAEPSFRVQSSAAGKVAQSQFPGLRYTFLRREGSEFVEAGLEDLKQGDTVEIRITANANGYLSVSGAEPVAVTAMQPYTTPPLPPEQSEVSLVFAKTPRTALATPAAVATEVQDRETFVVNTQPAAEIGFTITLTRK
jgi:hypothetical protein